MVLDRFSDRPPRSGPYERISLSLAERGWSVTPDFLTPLQVDQLRREAEDIWREGGFRLAGVGRGTDTRIRPEVRTDRLRWLDPGDCSSAQRRYLNALEQLRQAVNRILFLGLFDLECHLAVYPPGSYYRKHLDRFRGVELRTLSCILYLNADWTEHDGGPLRLYTDPADASRYEEILPLGGHLVTFLSARFPHEVMPARRDRISIAGWFKRRSDSTESSRRPPPG